MEIVGILARNGMVYRTNLCLKISQLKLCWCLSKQTEELRKERLRIRCENKKTENHEKRRLATLNRLKRVDDNELERYLRPEMVAANKELRLAMETAEERRARLENDAATKRLRRKKSKTGEDGSYAQLMLAM